MTRAQAEAILATELESLRQEATTSTRMWGYSKHFDRPEVEKPAYLRGTVNGASALLEALAREGAFSG